jgi:hypothetical protein
VYSIDRARRIPNLHREIEAAQRASQRTTDMRKTYLFILLLLLPLGAHAQQYLFGVYLDDKRIGTHHFSVERDATSNAVRVTSQAEFTVKVLRIPVFHYQHSAVENWRAGCLESIDTETHVNGTRTSLTGRRDATGFEVDVSSSDGEQRRTLPACIASYAYWDADTLRQHRELLNGQTGAYQPVEQVLVAQSQRSLLELKGGDFQIDVSYETGDGRWVALETTTRDGRTLHYRLESPPPLDGLPLSQR